MNVYPQMQTVGDKIVIAACAGTPLTGTG